MGISRGCALAVVIVVLAGCSDEKKLADACEKGAVGACDVLSARYAAGDGVAKDPARSKTLHERTLTLCQSPASDPAVCARFTVIKPTPLDLPKADASELQTLFSVTLMANGTSQVDGKTIANDDGLLELAREAHGKNAEIRAVIHADQSVTHGRVVHVLDLLKQAGIGKIAFGVSLAGSASAPVASDSALPAKAPRAPAPSLPETREPDFY